jgi:tetratricopeptide (TPR) repeat protein
MNAEATALKEIGLNLYREGEYSEAAGRFEAARELYTAVGDRAMAAEMMNNGGLCHRSLRHWEEAQAALEGALAEFRALGDRSREAQSLGNLGALAESRGDKQHAAELYEQAAALFAEAGDEQNRAYTLKSLSTLQLKQGRHFEALATMDSSLAAAPRLSPQQWALRKLIRVPMKLLNRR